MTKAKKPKVAANEECFTYTVSQIIKNVSIVTAILAQFVWIIWKAAQYEYDLSANKAEIHEIKRRLSEVEMCIRKIEVLGLVQDMMGKEQEKMQIKLEACMSYSPRK